jgi:hypothetical protein
MLVIIPVICFWQHMIHNYGIEIQGGAPVRNL